MPVSLHQAGTSSSFSMDQLRLTPNGCVLAETQVKLATGPTYRDSLSLGSNGLLDWQVVAFMIHSLFFLI